MSFCPSLAVCLFLFVSSYLSFAVGLFLLVSSCWSLPVSLFLSVSLPDCLFLLVSSCSFLFVSSILSLCLSLSVHLFLFYLSLPVCPSLSVAVALWADEDATLSRVVHVWVYLETTLSLPPMHLQNPKDISYVFSGYAPLSIRLLEVLLERPNGWNTFEEVRLRGFLQLVYDCHYTVSITR